MIAEKQTPFTVDKACSHSQTIDKEATKGFEPQTNTLCNQNLDTLSQKAKLSPEANSEVLYGDHLQIAREAVIARAQFEATHFQFWHQATPEEKEEALHIARAIIAADPWTEKLRIAEGWTNMAYAERDEMQDACKLLSAEVERLRSALEEYACLGAGVCNAPWGDGKCCLDPCGITAADALAPQGGDDGLSSRPAEPATKEPT